MMKWMPLKDSEKNGEPNGKLICYHLFGDVVSMLGTHHGEERWFNATDSAKNNHLTESGRYLEDLVISSTISVTLCITFPIIETISLLWILWIFFS